MTTDIKPDTSLYPNDLPSRFRALALIAEGQASGRQAQLHTGKDWRDGFFEFADRNTHYRLKPEPRVVWVNLYKGGSPCAHETKEQAMRGAKDCLGRMGHDVVAAAVRFVESPE